MLIEDKENFNIFSKSYQKVYIVLDDTTLSKVLSPSRRDVVMGRAWGSARAQLELDTWKDCSSLDFAGSTHL